MLTLCHGLKFDGGCGGCHTLPLGIYERTLLIRATYELVQKQAMPRPEVCTEIFYCWIVGSLPVRPTRKSSHFLYVRIYTGTYLKLERLLDNFITLCREEICVS